jgi:protein-S-isoprenylcysteine O-methyltransferase Ste14
MISFPLFVLIICDFIAIGLLPILFFRRDGQINLRWLATGAPFFVVPSVLLLGQAGVLEAFVPADYEALIATQMTAVLLSVVSIGMIAMTVGSHRIPLALWHQDEDAPVELVTWGPYARIRHPFYTSFLLAFAAAVLAFPHAITAGCLIYGFVVLTITAGREERRLANSEFGAAYREYMTVAGRFFPRLGS